MEPFDIRHFQVGHSGSAKRVRKVNTREGGVARRAVKDRSQGEFASMQDTT